MESEVCCRLQVSPSGESYEGNRRPGRKQWQTTARYMARFTSVVTGISRSPVYCTCIQEDICETIYSSLEQCCPALYLERAPVSALDLRAGLPVTRLHVYQPRTIIEAQLAGQSAVGRDTGGGASKEQLADLVAYGCEEVG